MDEAAAKEPHTNAADPLECSNSIGGWKRQHGESQEESTKSPNQRSDENASLSQRTSLGMDSDHDDEDAIERQLEHTPINKRFSVFTRRQKHFIVFMVAVAGFFSPLSANIYFPSLNTLSIKFGVSSAIINLTLTSYLIFQGLAPTVFGDLADMAGRRPAYILGFVIYIGACVGIACSNSYAALLILRCLQSTGSSGTIALGSGVVADIAVSAERGVWMGWATSGPMAATAIAPIIGGILTNFAGWRWTFWFLVILATSYLVPFLILFPETGRQIVGAGDISPPGWNMSLLNYIQVRKRRKAAAKSGRSLSDVPTRAVKLRVPNPLRTVRVMLQKDVALLLFYNGLIYSAFYDVIATYPSMLEDIYGFDPLQVGLCFLPFGFGSMIAPYTIGKVMDWHFRRTAKAVGYEIVKGQANDLQDFPIERTRIQVALPLVLLGDAVLLCYGWVMQVQTGLAAPLVLHFIMGVTLTGSFNALSVLLIDLYPLSPATATAANNLVRCLMGAGATAVVDYMISAMGRGWCFTLVAGIVVLFSPILVILQTIGPACREQRRIQAERKEKPFSANGSNNPRSPPDMGISEQETKT